MRERVASALKSLLRFYSHFGAGFVVGGIYVAALMTFPMLLHGLPFVGRS